MKIKNLAKKTTCCFATLAIATCGIAPAALAAVTDDIAVTPGGKYSPTAAEVDGVKTATNSHISKVVWAAADANFSRTFNYDFKSISCNGYAAGTTQADMPSLNSQAITVTQANKVSTSTDGSSSAYTVNKDFSWLKTGATTAADTFSHAGEYVYTVTEKPDTTADWRDSSAEYTMRVYVKNTDTGIAIEGITANRAKADDGTVVDNDNYVYDSSGKGSGVDAKVDPTDPNDPEDGDKWNALAGFEFMSVYEPSSDLNLTMSTTGDYASHDLDFNYTGMLTKAAYTTKYDTQTTYTGIVVDAKGTPVSSVDFTYGAKSNYVLKHDYKLVFDGTTSFGGKTSSKLPAGTMYQYDQSANNGYTNATETKDSMVADSVKSTGTEKGKDLSVMYDKTTDTSNPQKVKAATAKIGQDAGNFSKVTNDLNIVPTLANANQTAALVIAVCALIALAVGAGFIFRRRHMVQAQSRE